MRSSSSSKKKKCCCPCHEVESPESVSLFILNSFKVRNGRISQGHLKAILLSAGMKDLTFAESRLEGMIQMGRIRREGKMLILNRDPDAPL